MDARQELGEEVRGGMGGRGAHWDPMAPRPPPTMPPPCTNGPSFPAIMPAAIVKMTPVSLAIRVLTCTNRPFDTQSRPMTCTAIDDLAVCESVSTCGCTCGHHYLSDLK